MWYDDPAETLHTTEPSTKKSEIRPTWVNQFFSRCICLIHGHCHYVTVGKIEINPFVWVFQRMWKYCKKVLQLILEGMQITI